jgi:hypothetical protein
VVCANIYIYMTNGFKMLTKMKTFESAKKKNNRDPTGVQLHACLQHGISDTVLKNEKALPNVFAVN